MLSAFQIGSNRPFANRSASTFCTASLPRKWSMRKTCSSAKTLCTAAFSARADSRSVPNGFSMISDAPSAIPVRPIIRTISSAMDGGTER